MIVKHEFEPVFDEKSRVLILGTMPSVKSREVGFYYSHPMNRFWKVLSSVLGECEPVTNDEKKKMVINHGIALWDVLQSCTIEGSSDSSIRNPIVNDIGSLLQKSNIVYIITTGKKAHELYGRYCYPKLLMEDICLPSTSPANGRWRIDDLIREYSIINELLEK